MLWLSSWEFCRKYNCVDSKPYPLLRDRFSARHWLEQFKNDIFKMLEMRTLLSKEHNAWQLSIMSDEAVIDQVAELLISDSLHIHAQQVEGASTSGSAGREAP